MLGRTVEEIMQQYRGKRGQAQVQSHVVNPSPQVTPQSVYMVQQPHYTYEAHYRQNINPYLNDQWAALPQSTMATQFSPRKQRQLASSHFNPRTYQGTFHKYQQGMTLQPVRVQNTQNLGQQALSQVETKPQIDYSKLSKQGLRALGLLNEEPEEVVVNESGPQESAMHASPEEQPEPMRTHDHECDSDHCLPDPDHVHHNEEVQKESCEQQEQECCEQEEQEQQEQECCEQEQCEQQEQECCDKEEQECCDQEEQECCDQPAEEVVDEVCQMNDDGTETCVQVDSEQVRAIRANMQFRAEHHQMIGQMLNQQQQQGEQQGEEEHCEQPEETQEVEEVQEVGSRPVQPLQGDMDQQTEEVQEVDNEVQVVENEVQVQNDMVFEEMIECEIQIKQLQPELLD